MSKLIVVAYKETDLEALESRIRTAGYSVRRFPGLPRFFEVDGATPADFRLKDDPAIKRLVDGEVPVKPMSTDVPASIDALLNGGWGLPRICRRRPPWNKRGVTHPVETFYRYTRTGQGVDIYVIDTGMVLTHEDFGGRAASVPNQQVGDSAGHGTACASFAGGVNSGVAKEALLWNVRISNLQGSTATSDIVNGYSDAISHFNSRAGTNRPAIITNSFGGTFEAGDPAIALITEAVSDAIDLGIPCFLPAGNNRDDLDQIIYVPAEADPDAVIVAGSAMNDTPYYFGTGGTNFGATVVDIVAPSQLVQHADHNGDTLYEVGSGTSYGTPYTAGVAACMLQGYGRLRNRTDVQALKAKLLANATQGELVQTYGHALPDRLLYIDPEIAFETIPGLEDLIL